MTKSALGDLLAGFVALGVIMGALLTDRPGQNLSAQVVLASALFFSAGLIRGAGIRAKPWITGILVGLGAGIPICVMAVLGIAFTSKPHLAVFLVTSVPAALAGVYSCRLWRSARRWASFGAGVAWAVAVVLVAQLIVPMILEGLSTSRVKRAAPAFSFAAANGGRVTGESLRGRVAVLAFWATWCAPCQEELPRLNALYERYRSNPGVAFFAVDAEDEENPASSAKKATALFAKMGLSLPLALSGGEAARSFGVSGLPALFIIDQQGNVRLKHTGYDGAEYLERIVGGQITELLGSAQ